MKIYCRDLAKENGKRITSFFLVASKQCRRKRNGELYLHLVLCDRTGTIDAKLWTVTANDTGINTDDFAEVKARVSEYQGRYELTIETIRRADELEVDIADFLPRTEQSVEVMWAELCEFVEGVTNLEIRRLLRAVIEDEEISGRFHRAPAAKNFHHAYLGGLLEHVLSVCRLCDSAQKHYVWLNRDILIAGAVLHDIGKIHELTYDRSLAYSDRGQLIGHITMGVEILQSKATDSGSVSPQILSVLQHLILSHHGLLEFGSPVRPLFAEALFLHFADNLDSKLQGIKERLENGDLGMWTDHIPALGCRMLRLSSYLPSGEAN